MTERATAGSLRLSDVPMRDLIRELLARLGEDVGRPGLRRTPERVENSLRWLTRGYHTSVTDAVGNGIFDEDHHNMVIVKDIELYSLCEHHLLPFFGKAHVAYIPRNRIVGVSKLARLVEIFARRLQVQERLTTQIATTVVEHLDPLGVGVVLKAEHLCMRMRGIEKQNSLMVTSAMLGVFRSRKETRQEFMTLIGGSG